MFRMDSKTINTLYVICDKCGKETYIQEKTDAVFGFTTRMNGALIKGYTFREENGVFKNYCEECK